jgi:bifunctional non-homologous end joining protein LigD
MYEFCLPVRGAQVPPGPDWYHEIKYDGFRLLVQRDGDRVRLIARGGFDWTRRFPWIAEALARRPDGIFLSDFEQGEIGPDLFRAACRMGIGGMVSKHRDRPYPGGRQKYWIKVKNRKHPVMDRVLESFR